MKFPVPKKIKETFYAPVSINVLSYYIITCIIKCPDTKQGVPRDFNFTTMNLTSCVFIYSQYCCLYHYNCTSYSSWWWFNFWIYFGIFWYNLIWCEYCNLIGWSVWRIFFHTWKPVLVLWRHKNIHSPTTNSISPMK